MTEHKKLLERDDSMYVLDEKTGKEYYLNPFEKWWHYFLLCFTWFIPHKMYRLEEYSQAAVERSKERPRLGAAGILGVTLGLAIPNILRGNPIFEKVFLRITDQYLIIYGIMIYMILVIMVVIVYNSRGSKNTRINPEEWVIVDIPFFSFKTLYKIKWRLLGVIIATDGFFSLFRTVNISVIIIVPVYFFIFAIALVGFTFKLSIETRNGTVIRVGPML